jgi:hypothetical protein
MRKREVILEGGRRLIFYTFDDEAAPRSPKGSEDGPRAGGNTPRGNEKDDV